MSVTTWMGLEVILREINETHKDKLPYDQIYMWNILKTWSYK